MAAAFPASNNTYIPAFDTTGNLIVDFSRNVKDFKVNKYITLTPVKKSVGFYLRLDVDNAARQLGSKGDANAWPDGNDAPTGMYNNKSFEFFQYVTERLAFVAQLGYKAVEQSAWDIKVSHSKMLGIQAMTRRTKAVCDTLLTSGNYASTHVGVATTIGGGLWSAGTIASPIIQKSMMAAARQIQLDTAGSVRYNNLTLIVNPTTADVMARSAEIRDFIAQNPLALDQIRGNKKGQNAEYGLPDQLYGMDVVVEDTTVVTTPMGSNTQTRAFTFSDNYAVICAKQGSDLIGVDGQASFSTAHIFSYEEMNAETFDDTINRRHMLRVSDDFASVMVAPVSGYLITNVTS